ncbi:MAG: aminodeoxychorismate synthase component I [Chthoniobacterales bacterium]|nr:aminodeoxychorismate synthase component I [Chthoniobacterales bacterium]
MEQIPLQTPLQLAEQLHTKRGFVWLDSLAPQITFPNEPLQQGVALLAAEPDLILEGNAHEWPILEKELKNRSQVAGYRLQEASTDYEAHNCFIKQSLTENLQPNPLPPATHHRKAMAGAAIGYFRYDGSFYFGFYEKVHRFFSAETRPEERENALPCAAKLEKKACFEPDITPAEFCQQIKEAQAEIAAGNIYQVCLAHRFRAKNRVDAWPFYLSLRKHSPAPFAAYLDLGKEIVLSSSPECFLKIEGRRIITRPIKGTRPRGKTAEEDRRLANELQHSSKEKAELVMITDLLRNDLGQVCDYGTITTPQLLALESYPQVFHLVSTIEGQLRKNISHVEALAACFPGGSISGAPKKKAMEIIARLEAAPRGIFTGSIGYFGFDGSSEFNIAIRTALVRDGMAEFHVGAGITCNSIPEEEWEETLHKAAGILAAA